jgi:hypothetical protein
MTEPTQRDNFVAEQARQTTQEAKSWFSDLPWYVKFGAPCILTVIAAPILFSVVSGVINPNPNSLNAEQMKVVNAAADEFFGTNRVTLAGATEMGRRSSCSSTDSPPIDGRVSCTGTIPYVLSLIHI